MKIPPRTTQILQTTPVPQRTSTPVEDRSTPTAKSEKTEANEGRDLGRNLLVGVGVAVASLLPVKSAAQSGTGATSLFDVQSKAITVDTAGAAAKAAKFDSTSSSVLTVRFVGSDSAQVALPAFDSTALASLQTSPETLKPLLSKALTEAAVVLQGLQRAAPGDTLHVAGAWRVGFDNTAVLSQRRATHETVMNDLVQQPGSFRLTDAQQIGALWHVAMARIVGGMPSTSPIELARPSTMTGDNLVSARFKDGVQEQDPFKAPTDAAASALQAEAGSTVRVGPPVGAATLLGVNLGGGKLFVAGQGVVDGATALKAALASGTQQLGVYGVNAAGVVVSTVGGH